MDDKAKVSVFERAVLGKALEFAASIGDWERCGSLIDTLGEAAWIRPSLMGDSPQIKAFAHTWSTGDAPPPEWQAARRDTPGAFQEMEACALKFSQNPVASADAGRSAFGWLAGTTPRVGLGYIFESWSGEEEHLKNKDLSGWAEALGARASAGSLDAGWRSVRGLWTIRSVLAPGLHADNFDDEFARAGLLDPLLAASMGCLPAAERWIKSLKPEQALATLAAHLSESIEDWESFEAAAVDAGLNPQPNQNTQGLQPWRVLACEGAQQRQDFITSFAYPAWGSRSLALGYGYNGAPLARQALGVFSRQATPWLSTNPVLREWVLKRAPPEVANELNPSGSDYDFTSLSHEELHEAIRLAEGLDSPKLAGLGRSAAERLWELHDPNAKAYATIGYAQFKAAAGALWRGASPEAFEAFGRRLSELFGSAGEAAYFCGLPEPLLRRSVDNQPGSPGHLIALGRMFPPGCLTLDGVDLWAAAQGGAEGWAPKLRQTLGIAHLTRAPSKINTLDWMQEAAPEALPPIEHWGGINLLEPQWRSGAVGPSFSKGYESALDALCELALRANPEYAEPDRESFKVGDNAPARLAWRRYAASRPAQCAQLLATGWTKEANDGDEWNSAERVARFLAPEQKTAVAREMPAALENIYASWGDPSRACGSRTPRAHEVSRHVARELAISSEASFDERDRLCAASMAACAYGLGLAMSKQSDATEKNLTFLTDSALGLRNHLPRAALLLQKADPPWIGTYGFNGSELAAKAAWGALALESVVRREVSWGDSWNGIKIDPKSPQARALLSAMFTPVTLSESLRRGKSVLDLAQEAQSWIAEQGVNGFERLSGVSPVRSALELAVNCKMETRWNDETPSSFGPEICLDLVKRGANPSDPDAPCGRDALALAATIHRRESPSKLMKALLSSPLSKPGRGALWLILCDTAKAKLSEKLTGELMERARAEPEMSGLTRLAEGLSEFDTRAQREMARAFESSPAARALAGEGLLGAMARQGASPMRCGDTARKMKEHGLMPTDQDAVDMAIHGLLGEASSVSESRTRFERGAQLWANAGAWGGRLDAKSLPPLLAEAVRHEGLGEAPTTGEVYVALIARAWHDFDLTVVRLLLPGALQLHEAGLGSAGFSENLSKLLVEIQSDKSSTQLVGRLGSEVWARLEAVALTSAPALRPAVASKRI